MRTEYCVITGEEHGIYDKINQYFDDIQRKIDSERDHLLNENPNLLLHPHFERRTVGVRPLEFHPHEPIRPDDNVFMLLYQDRVVAVVTKQRNDFNNVQFSFFNRLEDALKDAEEEDKDDFSVGINSSRR
jgi:hypothetical protein